MLELQDRFRGTLLGVAIGDALGAPFEGQLPGDWPTLLQRQQELVPRRYTDDTHMTIGMAESLTARGGFDGADMVTVWARHFAEEPWRGYGAGPPQIFRLIAQGMAWDQAGHTLFGGAGSLGNGAAMRVAPAALLAFTDLEKVAHLARQTSMITHTHALGVEGAVLQAVTLAFLLQHPPGTALDVSALLTMLRTVAREPEYREKIDRIEALLPSGTPAEVIDQLGHGIAALESVPTAIYAFLRHRESFASVVIYAISLGGDADTIAAMAGALAGAYLGVTAIPAHWREQVEGAAYLQELADRLLALALPRA